MPNAQYSSEHGLQKAMFQRMTDDAVMKVLIGDDTQRIFDHVPENKAYPFVVIDMSSVPWDTSTEKGEEIDVQVDVWSDEEGSEQAWAVINRTRFLFDDKEAGLVIPGYNLVRLHRSVSDVVRDGPLFHGVQRFTAITEEV